MQALWRIVWRFLKKLKIERPYDPAIPLLGIYLEKINQKGYMHPILHSSTIYNSQDMGGAEVSTDIRVKKMWHKYAVEYYLAIKKDEIMPFAATWTDLEIVVLSS